MNSADDVLRAGRSSHARRRTTAAVGVATAILALLAVVGVVAVFRPGRQPADPPVTATSTGVTPAALGLDLLFGGNTIQRPDGRRLKLALPPGVVASHAFRVPDGWVLSTDAADGPAIWFAPDAGSPRRVGPSFGNHDISPDGRVLVGAGTPDDPSSVVAYELPTLRVLRSTRFGSGMGPLVAGVSGDRVLLAGAQGSPAPSEAAVWNLRTGALHRTGTEVWTWGLSRDGQMLRRVDRYGADRTAGPTKSCVDVVPRGDRLPIELTGLCARQLQTPEGGGQLSPDGSWVVINVAAEGDLRPAMLMRSVDVRAGQWRPIPLDASPNGLPLFWDTDESFIAPTAAQSEGLHRCDASGSCLPVVLPADLPDPQLVPRRGERPLR